jgi:hypothetical protein
LGGEILAQRPHVGGGILLGSYFLFLQEQIKDIIIFIQSSFKFVRYLVLTSTRNDIFTKFSSFLNQTRGKTGDANEQLTPHGHMLEQLVAAKKSVAAKLTQLADLKCQKYEYNTSLTACQEVHMPGAKRKDRGPEYLKKLVNYFTERETEVARSFQATHNRQATNNELLELVFEDRDEEDLTMIKEWFHNKGVCGRRARNHATNLGANYWTESDGESEAGSSEEASVVQIQSDSDRTDDPSKRASGGKDVKVCGRKTATCKTSSDMGKATQDFHAKMDRQFAMTERFIGEWAANQKKSLELQESNQKKSLELQEKQAQAQEKESAVRNMQALLNTGELSPCSKHKLVKSIANMLVPSSL